MKNIPEFEDFVNEGNLIAADDQSYLDQVISFVKTKKHKDDKDFTDDVLFNLRAKMGDRQGLVQKRFEKIYRAVVADVNKGKYISMDESIINENKYSPKDFTKDNLVHFKDGEVWIVVEPGMRNSNDRRGPNEITIKPFNKAAKDKNVSLPIDVSMEYLNDNVTKIESK